MKKCLYTYQDYVQSLKNEKFNLKPSAEQEIKTNTANITENSLENELVKQVRILFKNKNKFLYAPTHKNKFFKFFLKNFN